MSLLRLSRALSLSRALAGTLSRSPAPQLPLVATKLPIARRTRYLFYTTSATTTTLALTPGRSFSEFSTIASAAASSTPSAPEITLYQYEVCPFCNKVRAYLDYNKIPYRIIEVDPLRKTELSHLPSAYRKVPIALVNGDQINGSSEVISHVDALIRGEKHSLTDKENTWLKWLDDRLIHLIAPNIYRTWSESLQTFEYIADNAKFSTWQRASIKYSGATAMYFVGRRLKKKYDITNEREEMHSAIMEWTDAIRNNEGTFMGGDQPGVVDLSVYGVLKAIENFDTFQELVDRNVELGGWFERMRGVVGKPSVTERD